MAMHNSYTVAMPTPERTTLAAIVAAGRDLLETGGPDRVTMSAVAARVGVRAPSLYKRVRDRDDLVRLVAAATLDDLADRIAAVTGEPDARRRVAAVAHAVRAFAHERPAGYRLVFGDAPAGARPDAGALAHAAEPVLAAMRELAGEDEALEAARTVTAWANGFLLMELAGAFRLGGDVDRAFAYGVDRITAAVSS